MGRHVSSPALSGFLTVRRLTARKRTFPSIWTIFKDKWGLAEIRSVKRLKVRGSEPERLF
jgi:hypothetical protein